MGYIAVFVIVAIVVGVVFLARKDEDHSGAVSGTKGPGLGKPPAQP